VRRPPGEVILLREEEIYISLRDGKLIERKRCILELERLPKYRKVVKPDIVYLLGSLGRNAEGHAQGVNASEIVCGLYFEKDKTKGRMISCGRDILLYI